MHSFTFRNISAAFFTMNSRAKTNTVKSYSEYEV